VGAGGEPLEQVQFWCWSDSGCVSRITFPFPLTTDTATATGHGHGQRAGFCPPRTQ